MKIRACTLSRIWIKYKGVQLDCGANSSVGGSVKKFLNFKPFDRK